MLGDLSTSIATVSSDLLDQLLDGTVTEEVKQEAQSSTKVVTEKEPVIHVNGLNEIPQVNLDELEVEEDEKKEEVEEKVEDKAEEGEKEETPEDTGAINEVLKNTVAYLVSKGIFEDFDGREELEIDPETYAKLAEEQIQAKVELLYNDKKASAGEYGQAIIDHIEKGGNPDEIIDLFKEVKQVEEIELSDADSQKTLINKWYKEQHGWSDAKIKKYVDTLLSESDEALEAEAEEVKGKYEEHYKQELENLKARQEAYLEDQKKVKQQFEQKITSAIESRQVDDKTKKLLKDSVFKLKRTQDGRQVSDLYVKFAELQANPEQYAEFVEWVMDRENYLKRQLTPAKNEIAAKTFNFVKGNSALSTNKGSKHNSRPESEGKSIGIDFSSFKSKR